MSLPPLPTTWSDDKRPTETNTPGATKDVLEGNYSVDGWGSS